MPDSAAARDRLDRALASLLGPGAGAAGVRPIAGGVSNDSYAIAHGGRRYVVRLTRPGAGATLALAEELALLRELAALGLTPEPVAADAATGALLTRYLPGAQPWTAPLAREPSSIARIADVLRRLHRVPARIREFTPTRYAQIYIDASGGVDAVGAADRALAGELLALASAYMSRYPASVVCHNDLVAANVLDDGSIRLIDFEYAALGSPVLDLASLAAMNNFDRAQSDALLRAYFAVPTPPISSGEFAKVARMVRLIAHFWEMASARRPGGMEA